MGEPLGLRALPRRAPRDPLKLPPALEWWRDQPDGAAWIERLPQLVGEYAQCWDLSLGEPYPSYAGLVLRAERDGGPVVLKINFVEPESRHERDALAFWPADACVLLLEHDGDRGALLLERCSPGTSLWNLPEDAALPAEREFGVVSLVRDRRPVDAETVHKRLDFLGSELRLDRGRMRRWSLVHALWWAHEGDRLLGDHVEAARALARWRRPDLPRKEDARPASAPTVGWKAPMTAAAYTSRAHARMPRPRIRRQHVLALVGMCLPVPICAASGLALPLPATVERIAASLVPWAETGATTANDALGPGARGTILAGTDERAPLVVPRSPLLPSTGAPAVRGPAIVVPGPGRADAWPESRDDPVLPGPSAPQGAPGSEGRAAPTEGREPVATPPREPAEGSVSGPALPPPTTPSEPVPSEPAPTAPQPTVGSVVEEVVAPVQPVVDEVLAPVAPVVEDTTKVVDDAVEPVTNVLPGLGK